jgi:hypothetical protein
MSKRIYTPEERRAISERSRESLRKRREAGEGVDLKLTRGEIDQTWKGVRRVC